MAQEKLQRQVAAPSCSAKCSAKSQRRAKLEHSLPPEPVRATLAPWSDPPARYPPSTIDLIEELPAAVFVTDGAGRILQVNHTATEVLGHVREDLLGQSLAAFTHPDDLQRLIPAAATPTRRRRLRHPDGSYHAVDERMRPLADGRIMSVLHDVTTTAADADQLRDSREQLLFAANALPALIAYVDTDARYVWGNEAYRRWFGYSPEELVGRHASEVLGPAAWSTIRHHIERVLGGEEVSFDSQMVYSHGPARDVRAAYVPHRDASGRVRGFVGLVNDVSEMRRAEQALQHIERMLAESQAAAHVGSWEATFNEGDDVEPDSLRWSDENYRIFGYEPGSVEVNHRLFVACIHPDDREATRATTAAGRRRGGRFEKEFRIVRPDGAVRTIQAWTSVEPGVDGKPMRLLGTCQDVTERRLAEQEVRQAREQLQLVVDSTPAIIARGDRERRLVWTNKTQRRPLRQDAGRSGGEVAARDHRRRGLSRRRGLPRPRAA